eukprot:96320-Chlamydomonas_euryale.AAC.4
MGRVAWQWGRTLRRAMTTCVHGRVARTGAASAAASWPMTSPVVQPGGACWSVRAWRGWQLGCPMAGTRMAG